MEIENKDEENIVTAEEVNYHEMFPNGNSQELTNNCSKNESN